MGSSGAQQVLYKVRGTWTTLSIPIPTCSWIEIGRERARASPVYELVHVALLIDRVWVVAIEDKKNVTPTIEEDPGKTPI